jgi:hypothetical protein
MKLKDIVKSAKLALPLAAFSLLPSQLHAQAIEPTRLVYEDDLSNGIAYDKDGDIYISNSYSLAEISKDFSSNNPYNPDRIWANPGTGYDDLASFHVPSLFPESDDLLLNTSYHGGVDRTFVHPDDTVVSGPFRYMAFDAIAGSGTDVYGLVVGASDIARFNQYGTKLSQIAVANPDLAAIINGSRAFGASKTDNLENDLLYFAKDNVATIVPYDQLEQVENPYFRQVTLAQMAQIEDIDGLTNSSENGIYSVNLAVVGKDTNGNNAIAAYENVVFTFSEVVEPVDTDGDGIADAEEIANGTDPADPRDPWVDGDRDWVHAFDDPDDGDPTVPFAKPHEFRIEIVKGQGPQLHFNRSPGTEVRIALSTNLQDWVIGTLPDEPSAPGAYTVLLNTLHFESFTPDPAAPRLFFRLER